MGLEILVKRNLYCTIENLQWINGHSNHDGVTSNWAANLFFRDYLWK